MPSSMPRVASQTLRCQDAPAVGTETRHWSDRLRDCSDQMLLYWNYIWISAQSQEQAVIKSTEKNTLSIF